MLNKYMAVLTSYSLLLLSIVSTCYYPSPAHSVCEDTLVGECVSVCVLALNRLIANFNKKNGCGKVSTS